MKAIAITPGTPPARLVDRPEPAITAPDEVKVRVLRVGICGTDRDQVAGSRARAPDGQTELVIGHEMLGQVVEAGPRVTAVEPGDYAVFTVRRGCSRCLPCALNRADMCHTGQYRERGIWGLDGYQTEYVVDKEQYVVRVPPELAAIGVLTEPLSVAEKAVDEALRLQSARLPEGSVTPDWLVGRRCLVAGLGPIGLLAAMVLRLRGAEVQGLDIVDGASVRPRWLAGIGGYTPHFVEGSEPAAMHQRMASTVDTVLAEISAVQREARANGSATRPRWPMIVLRTPKGWTGPKMVDGQKMEGSWRSHQVPLDDVTGNPEHLRLLEAWMRSYRPEELFDEAGCVRPRIATLAPAGPRRMGANPHATGGLLLKELRLPDFREYALAVPSPGAATAEATRILGRFLVDVLHLNRNARNFRVFGPGKGRPPRPSTWSGATISTASTSRPM